MPSRMRVRRPRLAALLACALALTPLVATGSQEASHAEDGSDQLYLVTLQGPGTTGHRRAAATGPATDRMLAEQREVLDSVGAAEPVYRWTTALNGFAVELGEEQAETLAGDPRVAHIEPNEVRPLAETAPTQGGAASAVRPLGGRWANGGAGTVIGFVDTGIDPDNRAFSPVTAPAPSSRRFRGTCADAPDDPGWNDSDCAGKVVGAQHFVAGFGGDRLRSASAVSPRDTHGHGTEMASIAAGTRDVPVRAGRHRLGRFSGIAPRAGIAVYKACWSAPDPDDDGCATADLVAAIDRATRDRVDVLNLSVAGPVGTLDTVERALLGAVEADIVVAAAAGNAGADAYAAHPSPWVLTVGASVGAERVGAVVTRRGTRFLGAMAATDAVGPAPLVMGADVAADGARRADARVCAQGSLDARAVSGAIVVCRRGDVARVEKSSTVRLADGAGMVLVNAVRGSTDADLHAVPTVHLGARAARALRRWAERRADPRVRLVAEGWTRRPPRVAQFSSGGDPTWSVLKPDLVAPGTSVLAATPSGWNIVSGTSVATAHVSGAAAVLLGQRGVTPAEVRSALLTTATRVPGATGLRAGTGQLRVDPVPPLAFLVGRHDYRGWLTGRRPELNLPQAVLDSGRLEVRRTITNTGRRPVWLTTRVRGLESPVRVFPPIGLLRPGRALTFTISLTSAPTESDHGTVRWRGEHGEATRLSVVVTR